MTGFATAFAVAFALTIAPPVLHSSIAEGGPAPTVLHLQWDYTNATCSADLQFQVEQSTNLVNWTPAGTSYSLSLSVTSYTDHAFYQVKTLVP